MLYRLDRTDRIVHVSITWDRFAAANDGEAVLASRVLSRSIWDFTTDTTTRAIYRHALQHVRAKGPLHFTFRCDGPRCRRLMRMQIRLHGSGGVEFRTRTLSEEPRPAVPLLECHTHHSRTLLNACGWCNRISVQDEWMEVEQAVARLHLFEHLRLPTLSHGICDDCYAKMTDLLNQTRFTQV